MSEIIVEMGGIEIGRENDTLLSLGLGSCVGVIIYDPLRRIAGLAHVMLPSSLEHDFPVIEKKALIADRDIITRRLIKDIITSDFAVILESQEKDETISIYRKLKPQLSFISAFLPPTNGLDAIHTLLSIDQDINAIVISPSIESGTLSHYLSNGAREVILAPFTELKIKSCVDYVIHKDLLKFADRAVPTLIGKMMNSGAEKSNLVAKIVGGAHMFPTLMDEEVMNIGKHNIEAVKRILHEFGIRVTSEETGASIGRTVIFEVNTGIMKIRTKDGTRSV
ncbi:MAG: response regulator [archaeon]